MTIMGLFMGVIAGLLKMGVQIAMAFVGAIPFVIVWNGLVEKYIGRWIPEQFHHIPYIHMVGIILLITFVGELIQAITPKIVKVETTQKNEGKKGKE
jgi:Mg2+/Co2+ transporter CorB